MYVFFFFQAEDGIRVAQESRGLGDVYKRQTEAGDTRITEAGDVRETQAEFTTVDAVFDNNYRELSLIHI